MPKIVKKLVGPFFLFRKNGANIRFDQLFQNKKEPIVEFHTNLSANVG